MRGNWRGAACRIRSKEKKEGENAGEAFNKPGSVRRRDRGIVALARPLIWDRRYRRPRASYPAARRATSTPPYLDLLRMGFAWPAPSPAPRWALTLRLAAGPPPPPFHPCLCAPGGREAARPAIGGVFSVALSVGSPPLAVSQHPALWSPDFPPHATSPCGGRVSDFHRAFLLLLFIFRVYGNAREGTRKSALHQIEKLSC